MEVKVTPAIAQLCREAQDNAALPEDARSAARDAAGKAAIPWDALKAVAGAVGQQAGSGEAPLLHQLCRGGGLALPPPRPRQGKPPELQAHLDRLQLRLDQSRYDAMVADVTAGERSAAAAAEGGLRTYRQQMSFGLHVVVMMGAFYMFGHLAGMALTSNRAYHPAVGLGFMVFAMLLETSLFVVRTTAPPHLHHAVEQRARRRRRAQVEAAAAAAAAGGGASEGGSAVIQAAVEAGSLSDKKDR